MENNKGDLILNTQQNIRSFWQKAYTDCGHDKKIALKSQKKVHWVIFNT